MVQPVVIGAEQYQVVQLGGAAVFPVPEVMGVQTAGGATAGNRAHAVAVLERAAQPPVDQPGCSSGTDGLAVTLEPDFTGGITGQVSAFGVGQQRTQMQCRGFLLNIDMHHHGGVLPVRAAGRLGVPARLDQTHERVNGGRHRGPLTGHVCGFGGVVVEFPLVDQRIPMRRHRGIELRGLERAQGDPVRAARLGGRGS